MGTPAVPLPRAGRGRHRHAGLRRLLPRRGRLRVPGRPPARSSPTPPSPPRWPTCATRCPTLPADVPGRPAARRTPRAGQGRPTSGTPTAPPSPRAARPASAAARATVGRPGRGRRVPARTQVMPAARRRPSRPRPPARARAADGARARRRGCCDRHRRRARSPCCVVVWLGTRGDDDADVGTDDDPSRRAARASRGASSETPDRDPDRDADRDAHARPTHRADDRRGRPGRLRRPRRSRTSRRSCADLGLEPEPRRAGEPRRRRRTDTVDVASSPSGTLEEGDTGHRQLLRPSRRPSQPTNETHGTTGRATRR